MSRVKQNGEPDKKEPREYRVRYWDGFNRSFLYYDRKKKRNQFTLVEAKSAVDELIDIGWVAAEVLDKDGRVVHRLKRR